MAKRKNIQRQLNYWLIGVIAFLLTIIVTVLIIFIRSNQPMVQARKEAVAIAKANADLTSVDDFYWYNRTSTYFTVTGKNSNDQEIVVFVPQKGNKITVMAQSEGITEAQAVKKIETAHPDLTVKKVELGMYQKEAVWEITTKASDGTLSYYLIAFSDGSHVKTLKNI